MANSGTPELRGSMAKEVLRAIDEIEPSNASRIRARLPAGVAQQIESASVVDWLPLEMLTAMGEAVEATLSRDAADRFWRAASFRLFESRILRTIADGAVKLFRLTPRQALQMVPRVHGLLYRNAGAVRCEETGPNAVQLVHENAPREQLAAPSFAPSAAASYYAVLNLLRVEGSVNVRGVDPARGHAVFEVMWKS